MRPRSFFRSILALLGLSFKAKAASSSILECPWCQKMRLHLATRTHGISTEYRCQRCSHTHTRRLGDGNAYAFFPGNIERAFSAEVPIIPLAGANY